MAVIEAAFGTFNPFNKIVRDISKVYYKRVLAERAEVKGNSPELLTRMSTQQLRLAADSEHDFDDRKNGVNAGAQATHSRRKFKELSKKIEYV